MKTQLLLIPFLFFAIMAQSQTTKKKTVNGRIVDPIDVSVTPGFNAECDTIFSFSTTYPFPVGLTYDGSHFYSFSFVSYKIYKYTLDGDIIDSIPYPNLGPEEDGGDMDFDGTFLWLVNEQEGKIIKLDTSNGDTITSFKLPSSDSEDPDNFGCAYDNGYIWVTEYGDKTLMRINATTGALVDSFNINRRILPLKIIKGDLYGIQFPDYLPGDFQLVKFDKETGAVIDSVPWCLSYPLGIAWAANYFWGTNSSFNLESSRIYKIDIIVSSSDLTMTSNRSVSVYPNPASNQVTISSPDPIHLIEFYTVVGEKVFTMEGLNQTIPYDIDLSGFQPGTYFIRVFDRLGFYVEKLVVQ